MDKKLEQAQLLARLKLSVRRALKESVDLERLLRDAAYARKRLAELEEAALDEERLVLVLRVRNELFPPRPALEELPAKPVAAPVPAAADSRVRSYRMGVRS